MSSPDFAPDLDGVREWLYGDGDSATALSTVQQLRAIATAPPSSDMAERRLQHDALCVAEQWRLSQGDVTTVERTIRNLTNVADPREVDRLCATALAAFHAVLGNLPGASRAVDALDSAVFALEIPGGAALYNYNSFRMLLARLREMRGDVAAALRTMRRRPQFFAFPSSKLFAASLREEGRLAALTGDREGAIKAYRWYLTLVTDPEPGIVPTRDRVRAELARLERER